MGKSILDTRYGKNIVYDLELFLEKGIAQTIYDLKEIVNSIETLKKAKEITLLIIDKYVFPKFKKDEELIDLSFLTEEYLTKTFELSWNTIHSYLFNICHNIASYKHDDYDIGLDYSTRRLKIKNKDVFVSAYFISEVTYQKNKENNFKDIYMKYYKPIEMYYSKNDFYDKDKKFLIFNEIDGKFCVIKFKENLSVITKKMENVTEFKKEHMDYFFFNKEVCEDFCNKISIKKEDN